MCEMTTSTSTISTSKYGDWLTDEIMEFVRGANTESDALHNLKIIMRQYEKRKTAWQCFKQFIKKF